jgi:undecaprenyl-diphosphatase
MDADLQIAGWAKTMVSPALTYLMILITTLGSVKFVFSAAGLISIILWKKGKRWETCGLLVSAAGAELLSRILKALIRRPRPFPSFVEIGGYAFPSGHALLSITFYGFLFYLLLKWDKSWTTKVCGIICLISLILLIGFSRIYLNVHWLTDILGGYIIGLVWLAGCIAATNRLKGVHII